MYDIPTSVDFEDLDYEDFSESIAYLLLIYPNHPFSFYIRDCKKFKFFNDFINDLIDDDNIYRMPLSMHERLLDMKKSKEEKNQFLFFGDFTLQVDILIDVIHYNKEFIQSVTIVRDTNVGKIIKLDMQDENLEEDLITIGQFVGNNVIYHPKDSTVRRIELKYCNIKKNIAGYSFDIFNYKQQKMDLTEKEFSELREFDLESIVKKEIEDHLLSKLNYKHIIDDVDVLLKLKVYSREDLDYLSHCCILTYFFFTKFNLMTK